MLELTLFKVIIEKYLVMIVMNLHNVFYVYAHQLLFQYTECSIILYAFIVFLMIKNKHNCCNIFRFDYEFENESSSNYGNSVQ